MGLLKQNIYSLYEQQRLSNEQIAYLNNNYIPVEGTLSEEDLSQLTCNLCGVLVPKTITTSDAHYYDPQLVSTSTTTRNLHAVSLALSIGAPT
jgi:hypothetical protein